MVAYLAVFTVEDITSLASQQSKIFFKDQPYREYPLEWYPQKKGSFKKKKNTPKKKKIKKKKKNPLKKKTRQKVVPRNGTPKR